MSDDREVEEYLHELALLDEIESVLEGVDAALRRLDDGTFGRCEVCGAGLDQARLATDPLLTVCDTHGGLPVAPAGPTAEGTATGPDTGSENADRDRDARPTTAEPVTGGPGADAGSGPEGGPPAAGQDTDWEYFDPDPADRL